MDIVISMLLLLLLFPVISLTALIVKLKLGSPVLFKQLRPGLHGKGFLLYKFRTMKDLRDPRGELLADELRLTPVGSFLRKFSLDELPQLVNVLRGDMSLVGPRPLLMEYLSLYTEKQRMRHNVRPGITGWAQINGRNAITWEEKFDHDVWYVNNQSFLLDWRILFLTLWKVLKREGIRGEGSVTMAKFSGTEKVI